MEKKSIACALFLLVLSLIVLGLTCSFQNRFSPALLQSDIEAYASSEGGLLEWWNRPDYVCRETQCTSFMTAQYAVKVAAGTGDEAHAWNCLWCSDLMGDLDRVY